MYLMSTGMVCSAGLNAAAACAAIRAGIAKFDKLPYYNTEGAPVIGATVSDLTTSFVQEERTSELLPVALADCMRKASLKSVTTVPLLVGLAEEERPGGNAHMSLTIVGELESKLGLRFHPRLSRTIPKGHTAAAEALHLAKELFENAGIEACLVCGTDSYINARSLLWLEQQWRLKTDDNSDGVIPGEAAAAVLIQRDAQLGEVPRVKVIGLGFANESAHVLNEEPLLGIGLTEAARKALSAAGLQLHEMDFRLSDLTGESYGFKEQALVVNRLMRGRRDDFPIWHCADSIGDTGAAAGFCQLVIAGHAFCKNYAPGNQAICFASAVRGERAVAVLQRDPGKMRIGDAAALN